MASVVFGNLLIATTVICKKKFLLHNFQKVLTQPPKVFLKYN
jgi:hypothetical protein